MNRSSPIDNRPVSSFRKSELASVRIIVLVLVVFILGIGTGVYWINHKTNDSTSSANTQSITALPEAVKSILHNLDTPVEVRFYSLLDPASVDATSQDFSKRVDQLLAEYQTEAGGKLNVTHINSMTAANGDAASADGIKPFNMDKGDACFLGIAISQNGRKESLARLDPAWEQALQFDLARAIVHLSSVTPTATSTVAVTTAQPDKTLVEEVKRAVPNLGSVTLEEATQTMRATALNDFSSAVAEMSKKLTAARERVIQAQNSGSEAEQQAAMKEYEQLQAEQADKLKEIASRTQEQIQTLEQLKKQ